MIKKLNTFIGFSWSRKVLIVQTLVLSVYTYFLFAYFKKYARFGRKSSNETSPYPATTGGCPNPKAKDIAWAIRLADKWVPWKNVCRHQAYQAKLLCSFYNIPYYIFIGFKKDTGKNEIQAHAWTIANGRMITGFCDPGEYLVQTVYSN